MVKRRGPPSQGWRTFLRNHAPEIAAMDFIVVPTIGFDLLYVFVIVRLVRRDLLWINVTRNPTAEWVARQLTEAFPWDGARGDMIRDRVAIVVASLGKVDRRGGRGSPFRLHAGRKIENVGAHFAAGGRNPGRRGGRLRHAQRGRATNAGRHDAQRGTSGSAQ
jgi:hypothetical protein